MALHYSRPHDPDLKLEAIFRGNFNQSLIDPIPKIAHFIYANVKELTWLEWAAIRGAIVNLGVEKVHIWLPENEELRGWIWNRVLEMPEVRLRRIVMPRTVYGAEIATTERQSDIVRLKILYEEGGIFMDTDLVSLRSSDDIIYGPTTRATVMAAQHRGEGLPNGLIMSKPGSPFLKRWMQHYGEAKRNGNWDELSTIRPYLMHQAKDPDLTVLEGHTWFYPLSAEKDGDTPLKTLWLGKSWHDIDQSYGTHFWHPMDNFASLIEPKTIQTVDTPLFCRVRQLFDNLDDDGYFAHPVAQNSNCSIVWMKDLSEEDYKIFSDYKVSADDLDIKLVDSSGFSNHGWAPRGMLQSHNETSGVAFRNVTKDSFAIMPVPVGWDARVWTVRMTLQVDHGEITTADGVGLFKIRTETAGEIMIRVRNDIPYPGVTINLEWRGDSLAEREYQAIDDNVWISEASLPELKTGLHELAITHDRRNQGIVSLFLDGRSLANGTLPLIASPKIGQEIWFNAQEWDSLDAGFRGALGRFTMYADALSPDAIARPIASSQQLSKPSSSHPGIVTPNTANSLAVLLIPYVLVAVAAYHLSRQKRGVVKTIQEYARKVPDYGRATLQHASDFLKTPTWIRDRFGKG